MDDELYAHVKILILNVEEDLYMNEENFMLRKIYVWMSKIIFYAEKYYVQNNIWRWRTLCTK